MGSALQVYTAPTSSRSLALIDDIPSLQMGRYFLALSQPQIWLKPSVNARAWNLGQMALEHGVEVFLKTYGYLYPIAYLWVKLEAIPYPDRFPSSGAMVQKPVDCEAVRFACDRLIECADGKAVRSVKNRFGRDDPIPDILHTTQSPLLCYDWMSSVDERFHLLVPQWG